VISLKAPIAQNLPVWRPCVLEEEMLEWKPRLFVLMVLLVALSSLLGQFGWILPLHFGW
jgi:hypothetical protein